MNALQRLTTIAAVVETRGYYAMGKADGEALRALIDRLNAKTRHDPDDLADARIRERELADRIAQELRSIDACVRQALSALGEETSAGSATTLEAPAPRAG